MQDDFHATAVGPTADDFDLALFYVERFGELSKQLLALARVAGAGYSEQFGDEVSDAADVIGETVLAMNAEHERARAAIERCREALAIQNDRLNEGRYEPKPQFDRKPYDSAHDTLLAISRSLATAFYSWDHDLGDKVAVERPLNVAKLRENLSEACQWIVEQEYVIDDTAIEGLQSDARWECRQAKGALPKAGGTVLGDKTDGAEDGAGHVQRPRLSVDLQRMTATLDGVSYDVKSEQALRWLKVLADHPGEWIAGPDLPTYDTALDGQRTDKLRPYLPVEVATLIESTTGKGSRFNPGATGVTRS